MNNKKKLIRDFQRNHLYQRNNTYTQLNRFTKIIGLVSPCILFSDSFHGFNLCDKDIILKNNKPGFKSNLNSH